MPVDKERYISYMPVIILAEFGCYNVQEQFNNVNEENSNEEFHILYYCEEEVMNNQLFVSFLNNNRKAYDNIDDSDSNVWSIHNDMDFYYGGYAEKSFFIKDLYEAYYEKYGEDLIGIQVRSWDLEQDEQNELLIIIEYNDYGQKNGDLHVFHEEEGNLYSWECWGSICQMNYGIRLYDGGGISGGALLTKYNDNGYIEVICCREVLIESIEPEFFSGHYYERELWHIQYTVYDESRRVRNYIWEEVHYENGYPTISQEHQSIKDETEDINREIHDEQGDVEYISYIGNMVSSGEVEKITITELVE